MTNINILRAADTVPNAEQNPMRRARKLVVPAHAPTKLDQVSKLLRRPRGATITELCAAVGWQPHSVRALLSGLRKRGTNLIRETRKTGEGSYRTVAAEVEGHEAIATAAATHAA